MMKTSDRLGEMYADYYDDPRVLQKREITARQTAQHIASMLPAPPYGSLLDVGAGEGSVLEELSRRNFTDELHAVEISESGVETIRSKGIPRLRSVGRFDGYRIDVAPGTYDLGTAVHVLEHVEHERAFIEEVTRVCDLVYIEVPLELTARVRRAIRKSGPYGHINFYNLATFENLLRTAGAEVLDIQVFAHSREYEVHVSGQRSGPLKYALRSNLLRLSPLVATQAMMYLAGAVCRRADAAAAEGRRDAAG
jgi:predicted TPR repeat methyltransferase